MYKATLYRSVGTLHMTTETPAAAITVLVGFYRGVVADAIIKLDETASDFHLKCEIYRNIMWKLSAAKNLEELVHLVQLISPGDCLEVTEA